jgi:hypothetical protein
MKKISMLILIAMFANHVFGQSEQALRDKLSANPNDAPTSYALGEWLSYSHRHNKLVLLIQPGVYVPALSKEPGLCDVLL